MSSRTKGFSKSQRLKKAAEYRRVFDASRRFTDNNFLVLARENKKDIARLGMAISKKHVHSAIKRNRIKRLVRESFRHYQQNLAGKDLVVLTRKNVLSGGDSVIKNSLRTHWGNIKKCKKS